MHKRQFLAIRQKNLLKELEGDLNKGPHLLKTDLKESNVADSYQNMADVVLGLEQQYSYFNSSISHFFLDGKERQYSFSHSNIPVRIPRIAIYLVLEGTARGLTSSSCGGHRLLCCFCLFEAIIGVQ